MNLVLLGRLNLKSLQNDPVDYSRKNASSKISTKYYGRLDSYSPNIPTKCYHTLWDTFATKWYFHTWLKISTRALHILESNLYKTHSLQNAVEDAARISTKWDLWDLQISRVYKTARTSLQNAGPNVIILSTKCKVRGVQVDPKNPLSTKWRGR